MGSRIFRSIDEPIREGITYDEMWKDSDRGLIKCWENGRQRAERDEGLTSAALNGELPPLHWKGGVVEGLKIERKFGTLYYLAEWQGMRGENLSLRHIRKSPPAAGFFVCGVPDGSRAISRPIRIRLTNARQSIQPSPAARRGLRILGP